MPKSVWKSLPPTPDEEEEKKALLLQLKKEQSYEKYLEADVLGRIKWDPKQWDFIEETWSGKIRRSVYEIMIAGLNQGGKSTSLCGKAAFHATGLYPPNWKGRKWKHPITFAIGGETASSTRDLLVDRLLGPHDARGTGYIPAEEFDPEVDITRMGSGVPNQIESFRVKHYTDGVFDGYSKGFVFAYSAGWQRLAGYTLHEIFCDEEMAFNIYDEFSARLNATRGHLSISMTPILGETDLYLLFERGSGQRKNMRAIITFGVNDAAHMAQEHREHLVQKYANHPLAEARLHGRPVRGKGLVYTVPDELIAVDDFIVSEHWPQILGIDLPHTTGSFAAVRFAVNPVTDVVYLIGEYKAEGQAHEIYGGRLRAMGGDTVPCAWPHDAAREMTSGSTVADRYRQMGLNMLDQHAHVLTPEGHKSHAIFEAIDLLLDRMLTGRFYVFKSCTGFLDEKRKYRHDKGKVVRHQDDHLIDAAHKAIFMLRFAQVPGIRGSRTNEWRKQVQGYEFFGG
jgi:phage terminase large subunit-like protein